MFRKLKLILVATVLFAQFQGGRAVIQTNTDNVHPGLVPATSRPTGLLLGIG